MNMGLNAIDSILTKDDSKPDTLEFIYYLFWEKGIDFNEFETLPIPYIFTIMKSISWVKQEEEKAYKKARKK